MKSIGWFFAFVFMIAAAVLFQGCLEIIGKAITADGPEPTFIDDEPMLNIHTGTHDAPVVGPDSTTTDHFEK